MIFDFYSSVAGIVLIVHLIINWRQLVDWRNVKAHAGSLEFRHYLVFQSVFFVSDVLWGFMAANLECTVFPVIDRKNRK